MELNMKEKLRSNLTWGKEESAINQGWDLGPLHSSLIIFLPWRFQTQQSLFSVSLLLLLLFPPFVLEVGGGSF